MDMKEQRDKLLAALKRKTDSWHISRLEEDEQDRQLIAKIEVQMAGDAKPSSVLAMIRDTSRDFPEDASQENGNYENICVSCGVKFVGNKHRGTCKKCATPETE